MEEIKNASIAINLNEGTITMTGSEAFVEKNMEKVFSFVEKTRGVLSHVEALTETASKPMVDATKLSQETPEIITPKQQEKINIRNSGFIVLMQKTGRFQSIARSLEATMQKK